jgi:hypothetical protein
MSKRLGARSFGDEASGVSQTDRCYEAVVGQPLRRESPPGARGPIAPDGKDHDLVTVRK